MVIADAGLHTPLHDATRQSLERVHSGAPGALQIISMLPFQFRAHTGELGRMSRGLLLSDPLRHLGFNRLSDLPKLLRMAARDLKNVGRVLLGRCSPYSLDDGRQLPLGLLLGFAHRGLQRCHRPPVDPLGQGRERLRGCLQR